MGIVALLKEPSRDRIQDELHNLFFEATGYSTSDLLSMNYSTRTFLMRNGGKYRVDQDGQIEHLAGPAASVEDRWLD